MINLEQIAERLKKVIDNDKLFDFIGFKLFVIILMFLDILFQIIVVIISPVWIVPWLIYKFNQTPKDKQ